MTADTARRRDTSGERSTWRIIWIIARREVRDTIRDWRIVMPIVILTLIFPWLMTWTANLALDFVQRRNATLIGERMIPFLLLIVGFFPISFSLVIALETFVGEKERRSIEPLLSMPITDLELYLGKMLSATAPPLLGSLLGITVYLLGLYRSLGYLPSAELLAQILVLTIVEALVMVSGAVVVSSQTTSVRAANLLASFIIIPMALLIQAESVVMFWGDIAGLWLIALGLLVVMVILGVAGLGFGGVFFVRGARSIARALGVSEAVIGLTVVALGTSLPELVTSAVAALKGHSDISFGNIVGSNIFNILLVIGATAVIRPYDISSDRYLAVVGMPLMLGLAVVLLPFSASGGRISRTEGALFFAAYIVYCALAVRMA